MSQPEEEVVPRQLGVGPHQAARRWRNQRVRQLPTALQQLPRTQDAPRKPRTSEGEERTQGEAPQATTFVRQPADTLDGAGSQSAPGQVKRHHVGWCTPKQIAATTVRQTQLQRECVAARPQISGRLRNRAGAHLIGGLSIEGHRFAVPMHRNCKPSLIRLGRASASRHGCPAVEP